MLSNLETFVLYNTILVLCCLFSWIGEKKNKKRPVYIAYTILLILSVLRYDIGNDYENFYYDVSQYLPYGVFEGLKKGFDLGSLMVPIVSGIVPNVRIGPVLVIGMYSLLFILFIYKALDRFKVHTIGIFLLFVLLFLFKNWDWIKQGVAASIFLYSVKFIEERKPLQYIIWILFASLWHISALVTLLAYPLCKIDFKPRRFAIILVVVFILVEFGVFSGIYNFVLMSVPYYREVYEMSKYAEFNNMAFAATKTFVFSFIWFFILLYLTPRFNDNIQHHCRQKSYYFCANGICTIHKYSNIVFLGAVIYLVSSGSLLFDRISFYFLFAQLVLVPLLIRECKKYAKMMISILLLFHYLLFNSLVFNENGLNGSNKYETVFSENYSNHKFRYRSYQFFID